MSQNLYSIKIGRNNEIEFNIIIPRPNDILNVVIYNFSKIFDYEKIFYIPDIL